MIRSISISGFRGILNPIQFDISSGSTLHSLIIYGRNGTGKSSITDAWEWFQLGRIEHLRKEGALEASYPHKLAGKGETFIEIEFQDPSLGKIKSEFDVDRVRQPKISGDIDSFRKIAPHPCQIRFADLTRFVYLSKTEKFEALATLMGFSPQVDLQKDLNRVEREFNREFEQKNTNLTSEKNRAADLLGLDEYSEEAVFFALNNILQQHNFEKAKDWKELGSKPKAVNKQIVEDPVTKRIATLNQVSALYKQFIIDPKHISQLKEYLKQGERFINVSTDTSRILLMELYEQGKEFLELDHPDVRDFIKTESAEGIDAIICPLCGNEYDGDLLGHIETELRALTGLKKELDDLDHSRKYLIKHFPKPEDLSIPKENFEPDYEDIEKEFKLKKLEKILNTTGQLLKETAEILNTSATDVDTDLINNLKALFPKVDAGSKELDDEISKRSDAIEEQLKGLSDHEKAKASLVEDHSVLKNTLHRIGEIRSLEKECNSRGEILENLSEIVSDYSKSSIENVEERFSLISADVKQFFEYFEQNTAGLEGARLRILSDENRAVELEVVHHGESTYPAYKYLSESQLNSFGLAVFLASAKFFNPKFKFIILDDIVNSFDGHKRPLIIDLLKKEFKDHQLIILTHDSTWRDRLFEALPQSRKLNFYRWEVNVGPVATDGHLPIEEIKGFIDKDEPHNAGRNLGPFLEQKFQRIGANFEMLVPYRIDNVYTLDPLIDRFRVRVEEKLGSDHPLTKAITTLQENTGFRNVMAHEKNPEIQLTSEEISRTVKMWEKIEELVRCKEGDCLEYLSYDRGNKRFVCGCGKTTLQKA